MGMRAAYGGPRNPRGKPGSNAKWPHRPDSRDQARQRPVIDVALNLVFVVQLKLNVVLQVHSEG
jgi:hypothetical protein